MTDHPEALVLPVLPLRDVVVFPHMVIPLFVGRDKSVRALELAMDSDKRILLVAQKSAETDDPTALLRQLPSAALARGVGLADLSVGRPSLEDVYLELTAEADRAPSEAEPEALATAGADAGGRGSRRRSRR